MMELVLSLVLHVITVFPGGGAQQRPTGGVHSVPGLSAGAQPRGHALPSASGGPDRRSLPPGAAGGRGAETPRTAPSHWGSFGRRARPPSRHTANRPGALWSGSCPTP